MAAPHGEKIARRHFARSVHDALCDRSGHDAPCGRSKITSCSFETLHLLYIKNSTGKLSFMVEVNKNMRMVHGKNQSIFVNCNVVEKIIN